MMDQLTASIGHIKEGRIRPLAISSRNRSPLLPNVPTLDELGVAGYEASTWTGIFAPAGTPQPVLARLSASLRKAMASEAVRERYRSMGVEVMEMNQSDFAAYVAPIMRNGGGWRAKVTSSSSSSSGGRS
jgi:tripartite-type tricarboxylate transporter receptor subunit TctC